jgi:hypothetical protein
MEPESMVHALEQIHDLLKPNGWLIDIRPTGEKVEFLCPLGGHEHFIGHMQETDDYIAYRQAAEAVETVLKRGLFTCELTGTFEFRTYAETFEELSAFLAETWSNSCVPPEVMEHAKKLEAEHGISKTILREWVHIGLLRPVQRTL